jgi:predicted acylesterase/phospholipase RssA
MLKRYVTMYSNRGRRLSLNGRVYAFLSWQWMFLHLMAFWISLRRCESLLSCPFPSASVLKCRRHRLTSNFRRMNSDKEVTQKDLKTTPLLDRVMGQFPFKFAKRPVLSKVNITTLEQLNSHWEDREQKFTKKSFWKGTRTDYDALLRAANVMGDTQLIGSPLHPNYTHPVVKLLHYRRRKLEEDRSGAIDISNRFLNVTDDTLEVADATSSIRVSSKSSVLPSTGAQRLFQDGCKVALVAEGGGMRGCVSAGMVCAIHHLNLSDTIDAVYGSSAGTIVGAYFITKQLPFFGPEVYYDRLTTAGKKFIDTKRLLRAIGLGLVDPRLFLDVLTRRKSGGKPVLNLPFLLKTTVQDTKPLDWDTFAQRQSIQPLNVVTSGLNCGKSIVFKMANNGFTSLDELTDCMHASCLLPGIAGPIMNLDKRVLVEQLGTDASFKKLVVGNDLDPNLYEPIADALLYEPIPYRTAILSDNFTHCVVLRSRPDGTDVTGKGGLIERMIFRRFFKHKNQLSHQYKRLKMHLHKKIYGEDVIRLNEESNSSRDCYDTQKPHLATIAVPPGSPEVGRLEVRREVIFDGLRRGFARAYDCLVEDPNERGRGAIVAQQYFPDEILDYDPLLMDLCSVEKESAFAAYMRVHSVSPKAWSE